MRDTLQQLIARFGLDERVHLLGVRDDMPELYRQLDVWVSTSHSEALPLALMEAMASGLPVVATRVGGVSDAVEHGLSGWLEPARDFEAVATAVAGLLGSCEQRARMGRRARERALQQMGLDDCVTRTGELMQLAARPTTLARAGS